MEAMVQTQRFQRLLQYLDTHFHEPLSKEDIERISCYSYRHINRIFLALQGETIGQHIKRRKLEKAAEYLKFSTLSVSEIAFAINYQEVAAFSKAFKKHFGVSPSEFRKATDLRKYKACPKTTAVNLPSLEPLNFEIEELPDLEILYLPQAGAIDDLSVIKRCWTQLLNYAEQHGLLKDETIALGEVLDDDSITQKIYCRYHAAIVLETPLDFELNGRFATKVIPAQRYAKFLHRGLHENCTATYHSIFANWMNAVQLEFADLPMLEFYLNDEADTAPEDLRVEIYIPIHV